MQTQTGINLPVSPTHVDNTNFNHSLPQGNDVWPQVQFLPGADPNSCALAIGVFRGYAQSRAGKSPIHCFTYNILQQNGFQNQVWAMWCQSVVDFCDFLMRAQQNPPQAAADKAASRIYQVLLSSMFRQYPALGGYLDQSTIAGLNDAAALGQSIINDINSFKARLSGGHNPHQQQPAFNQFGGQPNVMPSHGNNLNQFAVQGVGKPVHSHTPDQTNAPTGSSGLFLGVEPVAKPQAPTSGWQSSPVQQPQQAQPVAPAQPEYIESNMRAPADVSELVIDPWHYVPQGFTVDAERPYDHIRNPGGVEIRPAHLVKWKMTPGTADPYPKVYNPQTHMRFLAKWVDGVVKECIVMLEPEMDYLKHEINETLRAKAMRPKGIVMPLSNYSQTDETAVTDLESAKELWDLGSLKAEHLTPIRLKDWVTGSSDLENESLARRAIQETLGLSTEDVIPPHEYITCKLHGLDVSEDCYKALIRLSSLERAETVVDLLKGLLKDKTLPLRYYNFIVKRLTQGVNDFLRDSLSITGIRIDDFIEDVLSLSAYLKKKKGDDIETVFQGNIQSIVNRAVSLVEETSEEDDYPSYALIDEYINFQLGILSDELSNLNLTDEACVVTPTAHPVLLGALRSMVERAKAEESALRTRMRVITADGFYYEVIMGKLVKGSLLLKRV